MEGLFVALAIVLGLAVLGAIIFMIVANCKLYEKMGEPGWKVFIPVYGEICVLPRYKTILLPQL